MKRRMFLRALPAAGLVPMLPALAPPSLVPNALVCIDMTADAARMKAMAAQVCRAVDEILARAADAVPGPVVRCERGYGEQADDISSFLGCDRPTKGAGNGAVLGSHDPFLPCEDSSGPRALRCEAGGFVQGDRIPDAASGAVISATAGHQPHSNEFLLNGIDCAVLTAKPGGAVDDRVRAPHGQQGSREDFRDVERLGSKPEKEAHRV